MVAVTELKSIAEAAIDSRRDWLIDIAKTVLVNAEPGFQEIKTARLVSEKLNELGITHESGIALTGIKGYLRDPSETDGPCLSVIGELDSLKVAGHPHADPKTGAAHACGHHCQIGMMLGVAVGLLVPEVLRHLTGNVALMALPAEEFIDVEYRLGLHKEGKIGLMSGKQEFIRLGIFDDIDMAMMVHTTSNLEERRFSVGGTTNGHVVKFIKFIGEAAHAGASPHLGTNALQAAMISLNALNAQRETLKNEDSIRLHGIITEGGASTNSIPAEVKYEGRVRGGTEEAIADANVKMDRCLRAGALAMGAKVNIVTIPGYLPLVNDSLMSNTFKDNALTFVGEQNFLEHPKDHRGGGSTDMGDLSQIMPVIHPHTGGATGVGHSVDYIVEDYEQALIRPAKVMAMTVIDLLAQGGILANKIKEKSSVNMTKSQYLALQEKRMSEELYDGSH